MWAGIGDYPKEFLSACYYYYERSYYKFLYTRPDLMDYICSFGECIDKDPSNVGSGTDYEKQESTSTHIQDIAVRNVMRRRYKVFTGEADNLLVIRGRNSNGAMLSPGVVPFHDPMLITKPSLRPSWAEEGSMEDFWQSCKFIYVRPQELRLPF